MDRFSFALIAAALVFATLFVGDLNGFLRVVRDPVATLESSTGAVRRLPRDELIWELSQPGNRLGLGDSMATGETTHAKILFRDGTLLELGPGSVVTLQGRPADVELAFYQGVGRLHVPERPSGGKIIASVRPNPSSERALREGEGEAEASESRLGTLPAIASALPSASSAKELSMAGAVIRQNPLPAPKLALPNDLSSVDLNNTRALHLEWSSTSSVEGFDVTLIREVDGSDVQEITRRTREARMDIATLQPGTYRWFVRAVGAPAGDQGTHGPASESRRIIILPRHELGKPVLLPEEFDQE